MDFTNKINKLVENNRNELNRLASLKNNKEYYVSNLSSLISGRISELSGSESSDPTQVLLSVINEVPLLLSKIFDDLDLRIRDLTVVLHTIDLVNSEHDMFKKEIEEKKKKDNILDEMVENGDFKTSRKIGERPEKLMDIRNSEERVEKKAKKKEKK